MQQNPIDPAGQSAILPAQPPTPAAAKTQGAKRGADQLVDSNSKKTRGGRGSRGGRGRGKATTTPGPAAPSPSTNQFAALASPDGPEMERSFTNGTETVDCDKIDWELILFIFASEGKFWLFIFEYNIDLIIWF